MNQEELRRKMDATQDQVTKVWCWTMIAMCLALSTLAMTPYWLYGHLTTTIVLEVVALLVVTEVTTEWQVRIEEQTADAVIKDGINHGADAMPFNKRAFRKALRDFARAGNWNRMTAQERADARMACAKAVAGMILRVPHELPMWEKEFLRIYMNYHTFGDSKKM